MSPARPPEGANSLSEGQGRRPKGAPVSVEPQYIEEDVPGGVPIKMWTRGVPVEDEAKRQLMNAARLPIVFKHIAAMPDVHFGIGATVGSVIPTRRAIIPAAVGVDIGCGMMAAKTTLRASDLPDNLGPLRSAIERAVPHGRAARTRYRRVEQGAGLGGLGLGSARTGVHRTRARPSQAREDQRTR
jgi:hypothetical protein